MQPLIHIDLFSGIGGFAYAADEVFGNVEHIFCDIEPFSQQVLKKHWPESEIFDDIKQIDTDSFNERLERIEQKQAKRQSRQPSGAGKSQKPFLLTGGFPCQPFSAAGLRRGTSDDRYLWPQMLRIIRLTEPEWVIAENVGGLVTWNEGLVLETVCLDLETAGYEVQPFIIPAVAVNAPHRRDRIWFIAHSKRSNDRGTSGRHGSPAQEERLSERNEVGKSSESGEVRDVEDSRRKRSRGGNHGDTRRKDWQVQEERSSDGRIGWERDWSEVAAQFCSVDDGLSVELDGFELSKSKHRAEQIKAYGNAIVPQVAMEIMRAMKVG